MLQRIDTTLPGVSLIQPLVHSDQRGFFLESYNRRDMVAIGIRDEFVQDNHSSSGRGVLRGLHYQLGRPQAKLVRVTRGQVFDVAVDIRRGSPHFGQWAGTELSEDNRLMLYIPTGFAHGFLVLSDTAEFEYKCSDFYARSEEYGIAWDDPTVGIEWPFGGLEPILSERDRGWCNLDQMEPERLPVYTP
jgi:dTDP-4-dehydrorhamnose 3,5-epimerase